MASVERTQKLHKLAVDAKQARATQRRTLIKLARDLSIAKETLQAIEEWNVSALPKEPFLSQLVIRYAEELQVAVPKELKPISARRSVVRQRGAASKTLILSTAFRFFLVALAVLAVFSYLTVTGTELFAGPKLSITSPVKESQVRTSQIEVIGQSESGSIVTVNGSSVLIDEDGKFTTTIQVRNGQNVIEVNAVNSIGRKTTKRLEVFRR